MKEDKQMENKINALSRIVTVEEHVTFPDLVAQLPDAAAIERGYRSGAQPFDEITLTDPMKETDARIQKLDQAGITVQVISYPYAGADLLAPREGRRWASEMNDRIAARVAAHPDHYAAFAHLPLTDPDAAADELERTVTQLGFKGALVNGATNGRFLDHASFEPVLSRAEKLDVPIYLHPAVSTKPVREALYGGLPDKLAFFMSASGWGWHVDTAVHTLRLLLSGAFERHSGLKIIIGHLGEGMQVMLKRFDQQYHQFAGFKGLPSEILRQHVWVGPSGFYFLPSFMAALDAFGPDRILFSVDYPFGSLEAGRKFLEELPVDAETLAKIAHGNADRLLKLKP
jgi:predicted TIM-barrel fold metal-dependent hydrolase